MKILQRVKNKNTIAGGRTRNIEHNNIQIPLFAFLGIIVLSNRLYYIRKTVSVAPSVIDSRY